MTESSIVDCGDGTLTLTFVWPERPTLMNEARHMHHRKWSEVVAHWREQFRLLSAGCPSLAWCSIVVAHEKRLARLPDVAACVPSFKAALDGIVLGGVLADDSPGIVRSVMFVAPECTGRDALVLTLTGPAT